MRLTHSLGGVAVICSAYSTPELWRLTPL